MTDSVDSSDKMPKKYVWILTVFVIGLIVGTATSTYNHLKSDKEKDEGLENQVSQDFDINSIKGDMNVAFNNHTSDISQQLRRISSALGIDSYLSTRVLKNRQGKVGYLDIKGGEEKKITVVVVELDQQDVGAKSTKVVLSVAVIKSMLGEREFAHSLRFVYVPKTKTAAEHARDVIERGETLSSLYILRASKLETDLEGKVMWKSQQSASSEKAQILSHPVLKLGKKEISEKHLELTLLAGRDLREILIEELK